VARPRRTNIRDVARASGVSPTTVSLILNNLDQRISEATRQRVREAMDRLHYRPNRLAQGLQTRRSGVLAVVVPELRHTFADVYFGELISGIYDKASRLGYQIMLEVARPEFVRTKKYSELFDRCFIDGMVFIGSNDRHEFVADFAGGQYPFVLANNYFREHDLNHVVCDYWQAGRLVAGCLAKLGHRRIGMIHGALDVQTARDLQASFAAGLAEHGVRLEERLMVDGMFTEEGGGQAVVELLRRDPELTAVFAGNDKMAIGAVHQLLEMGRRVPEDISVIGCDDIPQAPYITPSLTTVRMPLYELGMRACERLVQLIRGQIDRCREVMPVELIHRSSVCAPARAGEAVQAARPPEPDVP